MIKCKYFEVCGGCSLQHMDYENQVLKKKEELQRAIDFNEVAVFPSKDFHYRNRMEFLHGKDGLGLRMRDNPNQIIPIDICPLVDEQISIVFKELRSFVKKKKDVFANTLKAAVVRCSNGISSVSFVIKDYAAGLKEAVSAVTRKKISANNVIITYVSLENISNYSEDYNVVKGNDMLSELILGREFSYNIQGFFQNNSAMARLMQSYVSNILQGYDTKEEQLLDLYSGVGTFGIINSSLFSKVFLVESSKKGHKCALLNISKNKAFNVSAYPFSSNHMSRIKMNEGLFAIADPPRSGMDEKTIELLKRLKPKVLIYVSCNCERLAKDVKKFKNYRIKSAAMFDFFPQTEEFESVVEMVRV